MAAEYGLELLIQSNEMATANGGNPFDTETGEYTRLMLTEALKAALDHHGFDPALSGGRRDEEKSHAEERIFSLRAPTTGLFEVQIVGLKADSRRFGTTDNHIDFALLLDGLEVEREQGITIDAAYRFFATSKRAFVVPDAPGHQQYTRNTVTGASNADLAILLVDARKGLLERLDRFFRGALSRDRSRIRRFRRAAGLPVDSADPPVGAARRQCRDAERTHALVFRPDPARSSRGRRPEGRGSGVAGTVASGRGAVGDRIAVAGSGGIAPVERIVTFDGDPPAAEAVR